jgi:pyruvate carboxylase subunit B
MELIARNAEREESLKVTREGGVYRVTLGETVYEVDAVRWSETGRSLRIDGMQHEVVVRPLGNGTYQVSSSRGLSTVEVVDPLTHLAREAHADEADSGLARTTAYMPGRVVSLLASEGDSIAAGQGVLVLEAMKMENEIAAEREGVLRRILVEEGQAVETGDPLFEVE